MEFTKLTKFIANLQKRQAQVVDGNKAFKKLSKQQQRITIAKDALQQLNAKKYTASPGNWCNTELPKAVHNELRELEAWDNRPSSAEDMKNALYSVHQHNSNVLQPLLQEPGVTCEVCALGSLFASAVRKADNCSVNPLRYAAEYGDRAHEADSDDVNDVLGSYFSEKQQRLMELAFEEGSGSNKPVSVQDFAAAEMYNGKNPTQRLRAILKNIIDNDGVFKLNKK